ncbi:MAG: hypothetical protein JEZ08_13620 [Clostridiales bacterium]|nr:hypothetical protein [Clostridiales bacterium]
MDAYFKSSEKLLKFYLKIVEKKQSNDQDMTELFLNKNAAILEQVEAELFQIVSDFSSSQIHDLITEIQSYKSCFSEMLDDLNMPLNIAILGNYNKETFMESLCGYKKQDLDSKVVLYKFALYDESIQMKKNDDTIQSSLFDHSNELMDKNHQRRENLINNYQLLKTKYIGQEEALQELEVLFQKELSLLSDEMDQITYYLKRNILKDYSFVDVNDHLNQSLHQYDGLLYLIDPDKFHFQQDELLMAFLESKKAIGVLDDSSLLKDAKSIYRNKLDYITVIRPDQSLQALEQTLEDVFLKKVSYVKRKTKRYYGQILYDEIQKMIFDFIKELRLNEEKRKKLSSEFREAIEQEKRSIKVRVDWTVTNYEIKTRNNIEACGKTLLDFKGSFSDIQSYIEKDVLGIEELSDELDRLKDKTIKSMSKFYAKHSHEIMFTKYEHLHEEHIDFNEAIDETSVEQSFKEFEFNPNIERSHLGLFNLIELNSKLSEVFDKPGFMLPFAKKKKITLIQSEIQNTADTNITEIKNKLYQEIEKILNASFEEIFVNIDRSFEKIYCSPRSVSQVIRSLETLKKHMVTPTSEKTIKELIVNKA